MSTTFYKSCQLCLLLLTSYLVIPDTGNYALAKSMGEVLPTVKTALENDNISSVATKYTESTPSETSFTENTVSDSLETSAVATASTAPETEIETSTPLEVSTPLMAEVVNTPDGMTPAIALPEPEQQQAMLTAQPQKSALETLETRETALSQSNSSRPDSSETNLSQASLANTVNASSASRPTVVPTHVAQATPSSIVYLPNSTSLSPVTPVTATDPPLANQPRFSQTALAAVNAEQLMPSVNGKDKPVKSSPVSIPLASGESDPASSQLVAQNTGSLENPELGELYVPGLPQGSLATRGRLGVPASSISTPLAFGAQQGNLFTAIGYQATTRGVPGPQTSGRDDGGFSFGFGMGNSIRDVAMEVAITSVSTFRRTPFSGGTVSLKFHSLIEEDLGVAVGIENLIRWGINDGGSSVYGVVTKRFRLTESPEDMFSTLTVSGGVGTGRFRSIGDIRNNHGTFNAFGSVGLQVAPPVSVIADWSGQDLGLGVSVAPFANVPLSINAAVVDLTGNANSDARFVMGVGYGFNF